MSVAEIVSRLIAAGAPPEVAAVAVTEAFAAGAASQNPPTSADITTEKRRAYDRERQRKLRRHPPTSADNPPSPTEVLTLKKDNKKVRATKHPCPPTWEPNEKHFEAAEKLHIPRTSVLSKAEDMRIWAGSTGATKVDWDLTFHGFLRRDAPKLREPPSPTTAATITPGSPSWNAWKSHYRDTKQNFSASHMDKCASDGKAFTVPSTWPPGHRSAA